MTIAEHFDKATDAFGFDTFTAAELQAMDFPPVNWIVPDILPEGLALLCGKPKLGKSWLALDMACAVAVGSTVL